MPLVRIEIIQGRSADEKAAILDGVHAALVEAFRIPDQDRTQRVVEHPRENFEIEHGKTESYTLIEITALPGRSQDAKRALYRAIVRNLEAVGVPPTDVFVVLHEPPLENWGIRGGLSASDVDLGFELNV